MLSNGQAPMTSYTNECQSLDRENPRWQELFFYPPMLKRFHSFTTYNLLRWTRTPAEILST